MDFFEAQARAKKRTSRLLLLFGVAVAGTIVAAYVAAVMLLHYAGANDGQRAIYGDYDPRASAVVLWQPGLFGLVSIGTLVVVGLARLWRWFIGHPDARVA